jgi:potassium-dependent mechanosensitive channel
MIGTMAIGNCALLATARRLTVESWLRSQGAMAVGQAQTRMVLLTSPKTWSHRIKPAPQVWRRTLRPARLARALGPGVWATLCLVAGMVFTSGASAVSSVTNDTAGADLTQTLQARLGQAKAELNHFQLLLEQATNLPAGAPPAEVAEYRVTVESLVLTYQQHLDELARLQEVRRRPKGVEEEAATWSGFTEPGPYSILMVDDLRDSVESLTAKITAAETTHDVLVSLAAQAKAALKASDGQLRLLAEELETATEAGITARLNWQKTLEEARNRLSLAESGLVQTRLQLMEAALVDYRQRLSLARRQLAVATQHTRFSQADLDRLLAAFEAERHDLEAEVQQAETDNQRTQEALATARQDVERIPQTAAVAALPALERAAKIRDLQDVLELRTVQAETSGQRLIDLRQLLELVLQQQGLWQMRFNLFGTRDLAKLQEGYQRLGRLEAVFNTANPHYQQQISLAGSLITEQRNRLRDQVLPASERARIQELMASYAEREQLAYRVLRDLERMERLTRRWQESLDQERRALPFAGRVRDLFAGPSSFASKLWRFELYAAQDTITVDGQPITGRRSVTVAKVAKALLILAFGYWFALLLGRLLEGMAVRRFKVERAQAALIRRWLGVALVMALVVFSLIMVKIPLTVFAFLGGALAIGLGFGTQNLLKNFISGIIILFERPFRIGDVLDIAGHRGTVSSIGLRSSVLQLTDSTEMLIPNSVLLENNLTNWTYTDGRVRFTVPVRVPYGSDTRFVARVLTETAQRHGQVEHEPAPQAPFLAFGEKELRFELRFWVDVKKHNAAQITSDLHHMIAGALSEHGLAPAVPHHEPAPKAPDLLKAPATASDH